MWPSEKAAVALLHVTYRSLNPSSSSTIPLNWNDKWLQDKIPEAAKISALLTEHTLGKRIIVDEDLKSLTDRVVDMLKTIMDDLPRGILRTNIVCEDREIPWENLIKLKDEDETSRYYSLGARILILSAIWGVRDGFIRDTQFKVGNLSQSQVGIADDFLFEEERSFLPAHMIFTINGETREASLKEAWDQQHLIPIKVGIKSVDDVDRLLNASIQHLCRLRQTTDRITQPIHLASEYTSLAHYKQMDNDSLNLHTLQEAQKLACTQLIKWCNLWQTRMEKTRIEKNHKATLSAILKEAASRAPLFRRYKLFVISVNQLSKMIDSHRSTKTQPTVTHRSVEKPEKTANAEEYRFAMHEQVSAALAKKDDAWLMSWLDPEQDHYKYNDFKSLIRDTTVSSIPSSGDVSSVTDSFEYLTEKMTNAEVWKFLSTTQRQRIRNHIEPLPNEEKEPISISTEPSATVAQPQEAIDLKTAKKKKKKKKRNDGKDKKDEKYDDDNTILAFEMQRVKDEKAEMERDADAKLYALEASSSTIFLRAKKGICSIHDYERVVDVNLVDATGHTLLMYNCMYGHKMCINKLLSRKARVDLVNNEGLTALMFASSGGYNQVASVLLEAGAVVDTQSGKGWTALTYAAQNGHEQVARVLIENDAAVNAQDDSQWTALMYAAQNGHEQVARVLLEAGAVADATEEDGWTALMFAAQNGHDLCARVLIEAGAVVNQVTPRGSSAILEACKNGNLKCIRVLVEFDKNVLISTSEDGWTPLMLAAQGGDKEVVLVLIELGAEVNITESNSYTALLFACLNRREDVAEILINAGASLTVKDSQGWTALMFVAQNNNERIVRLLIKHNAEVNAKNHAGWTALMFAAEGGFTQIIRMLIEAKADVNVTDEKGYTTALILAAQNNHDVCVNILLNAGAIPDGPPGATPALIIAAEFGHEQVVSVLLNAMANIDAADNKYKNCTALMVACEYGHVNVVIVLLKSGAALEKVNEDGQTALMFATRYGHDICVRVMIEKNANIEATQNEGFTALMFGAHNGHERVTNFLLEAGAVVNSKNKNGMTALMLASSGNHDLCINVLLEKGADVGARNNVGWTALMYAAHNGYVKSVRVLLDAGAAVGATTHAGMTALELASSKGHEQCVVLLKAPPHRA